MTGWRNTEAFCTSCILLPLFLMLLSIDLFISRWILSKFQHCPTSLHLDKWSCCILTLVLIGSKKLFAFSHTDILHFIGWLVSDSWCFLTSAICNSKYQTNILKVLKWIWNWLEAVLQEHSAPLMFNLNLLHKEKGLVASLRKLIHLIQNKKIWENIHKSVYCVLTNHKAKL